MTSLTKAVEQAQDLARSDGVKYYVYHLTEGGYAAYDSLSDRFVDGKQVAVVTSDEVRYL